MDKDYYDVLGIQRNASDLEIKKAFRVLARKHHPDVNKEEGSEEKFKEINEAYRVLSDPHLRKQYDQFGNSAFKQGMGWQGQGINFEDLFKGFGFNGFGSDSGFGFEEFFSDVFGGNFRRQAAPEQLNQRIDLSISLEEAVFGAEKTIEFERNEACHACNGVGGSEKIKCRKCLGKGFTIKEHRNFIGFIRTQNTCNECHGTGFTVKEKCIECNGHGIQRKKAKLKIKIPEGVDSGDYLTLEGQGSHGRDGGKGGLFVVFFVKKNSRFKRDGPDLFVEEPISFIQAALGSELLIEGLDSKKLKLKIPEGTQTGTIFRLKEKGAKALHSGDKGDLFVKVKLVVPENLSAKQKRLLLELQEDLGDAGKDGFFKKLKKQFDK